MHNGLEASEHLDVTNWLHEETKNCANVKRIWFVKIQRNDSMRFGEKLSFLRKKQGMTQMELAEKLDISRQAVSRWEQGTSEPSTENLVSIGKLFGVSVDDLVNESVQLQAESTVQVAMAERKETADKRSGYTVAKIVGVVIFAVVILFAALLGVRVGLKEPEPEQNPIDIEGLEREILSTENLGAGDLPLELVD